MASGVRFFLKFRLVPNLVERMYDQSSLRQRVDRKNPVFDVICGAKVFSHDIAFQLRTATKDGVLSVR